MPSHLVASRVYPGMATKSLEDIAEIYEGHGKVFENVFNGDAKMIAAFIAWAKTAYPRWYDEVDEDSSPGTRALLLETLIYDEENEAESIAPFFAQLPDAMRAKALATLASGDD
jgi:hypothetical protein